MKNIKREFWEKAEVFIKEKIEHSFPHLFTCNTCIEDFEEIVKFIAHELRMYATDRYFEIINSLKENKNIDETLKKKLVEELGAKETEFEIVIIRALEDWGITTSDKELIRDEIEDWFKKKEVRKNG
jgi:hypothetical protein